MQKILVIFFLFFFNTIGFASNNYFLMLKNNKVNVRYGPSFDYPIKFIYKKKFLPVEIVDKKENFRKILDHKKNSGWIHISQLKKANSFVSLGDKLMFKKPSKFSRPIAKVKYGRLLIVKKCHKNWCKVITDDVSGWIDIAGLWGNLE